MKNIIIADDSQFARTITKMCFEMAGCDDANFLNAENGKEALTFLREKRIDLIVTDLNMPVMSGLELVKEISENSSADIAPILVVSSSYSTRLESNLLKYGVIGLIKKPISPAKIVQILGSLFETWVEK